MAVQFCGTCGHPLIPDQLFCQHCGSRVDENATRAAQPVTPGIPVSSGGTLYCGECGALVGSQDRVCRRCGAPVEPSPGLVADSSLTDAPTMMGTPPPPAYQTPSNPRGQEGLAPGYAAQQPPTWGASYRPGPPSESATFTVADSRPGTPPPYPGSGPGAQPPPYRPSGPGQAPRQNRSWPLVLAVALVTLAVIVGGGLFLILHGSGGNPQGNGITPTSAPGTTQTPGGPTVTPSPTQVVLNTTTGSALIQQYFDDINAKNYDAAYNLLSPEYLQQHPQSRQSFAAGFKNTRQDILMIDNAVQQADGTVQVNIHLQAVQTNGTVKNFSGYYIVTQENGQLLILGARIS